LFSIVLNCIVYYSFIKVKQIADSLFFEKKYEGLFRLSRKGWQEVA